MKNFKYIVLLLLPLFFTSCSQSIGFNFSTKDEVLILGPNKNNSIKVQLSNEKYQLSFNRCSNFSYAASINHKLYGKLFIENISLDNICFWNGLPLSFLETKLSLTKEISSMRTIENFELKNYKFKTYLINNTDYLSVIYIFGMRDILIVDNDGKLYKEVLEKFKVDYKDEYSSKKRFNSSYNKSIVRDNFLFKYFQRKIIIPRS